MTANIENLKKVREAIATHEEQFYYQIFFKDLPVDFEPEDTIGKFYKCGTPACVAGWACYLGADHATRMDAIENNAHETAQIYLGLNELECEFLFYSLISDANVKDALARLDWLIEGRSILDYSYAQESWASKCNIHVFDRCVGSARANFRRLEKKVAEQCTNQE